MTSAHELAVLSSAVVGGGPGRVREIVNMHVDDKYDGDPARDLEAFADNLGVTSPCIGW